jgi:hypothetical protein
MNQADITLDALLFVDGTVVKSAPVTRLIAYLSACMLAAALGGMVGPTWSRSWAIFGAFGLASATGLDVLNRSRTQRADQRRRRQLTVKAETKLDEMIGDMESSDAVYAALRQLQLGGMEPISQETSGQPEPRLPLNKAVTITPLLRSPGDAGCRRGEPFTGRLRNISRHGFGLAHDQRVERGFVLLEVETAHGERIQFVTNVLWCERQDGGGCFSGGKLLDVVNQCDV